jgi:hypothetical protein
MTFIYDPFTAALMLATMTLLALLGQIILSWDLHD